MKEFKEIDDLLLYFSRCVINHFCSFTKESSKIILPYDVTIDYEPSGVIKIEHYQISIPINFIINWWTDNNYAQPQISRIINKLHSEWSDSYISKQVFEFEEIDVSLPKNFDKKALAEISKRLIQSEINASIEVSEPLSQSIEKQVKEIQHLIESKVLSIKSSRPNRSLLISIIRLREKMVFMGEELKNEIEISEQVSSYGEELEEAWFLQDETPPFNDRIIFDLRSFSCIEKLISLRGPNFNYLNRFDGQPIIIHKLKNDPVNAILLLERFPHIVNPIFVENYDVDPESIEFETNINEIESTISSIVGIISSHNKEDNNPHYAKFMNLFWDKITKSKYELSSSAIQSLSSLALIDLEFNSKIMDKVNLSEDETIKDTFALKVQESLLNSFEKNYLLCEKSFNRINESFNFSERLEKLNMFEITRFLSRKSISELLPMLHFISSSKNSWKLWFVESKLFNEENYSLFDFCNLISKNNTEIQSIQSRIHNQFLSSSLTLDSNISKDKEGSQRF